MTEIKLCKSCLKDCGLKPKKFRRKLREKFAERAADQEFEIEITSCLKVCPRANLAFSLRDKNNESIARPVRTMARAPTTIGVIEECLNLLKKT